MPDNPIDRRRVGEFNTALLNVLRSLVKRFESIQIALDSIAANSKTANEADKPEESPVVLNAILQLPEAVSGYCESKTKQKPRSEIQQWLSLGISVLTLAAVVWYACVTRSLLGTAQDQLMAMRQQTEISQRPWVGVELSITDNLRFDTLSLIVPIDITIKNYGSSVASGVWVQPKLFIPDPPQRTVSVEEKRYCTIALHELDRTGSPLTLFPDQERIVHHPLLHVDQAEFEAALKKYKYVAPTIIVCVAYSPGFNSTDRYLTGIGFVVREATGMNLMSVKDMPAKSLKLEEADVPSMIR